jgi:SAM-dependent methyltransferase
VRAEVAWHDAECAAYLADLPVWRALAARTGGPVLDVGAGTGRVALDLARAGHDVVALDLDPVLLEALGARAAACGVTVPTVVGDAERLDAHVAGGTFALVLVPMQTVQLLADRAAFLRAARRVLRSGGVLAVAIAEDLAAFDATDGILPTPDVMEREGWRFVSQPTAVRLGRDHSRIERVRVTHAPDGTTTSEPNVIELAVLDAATLAAEGRAAGLTSLPGERIAPTPDHVGSSVVVWRA